MYKVDIDRSEKNETYIQEAKNKQIHLACWASLSDESYCSRLFKELMPALETSKVTSSIKRVIESREAGSLYPYAYLTILPLEQPDVEKKDSNWIKYISELIVEANEKYIKCDSIVFLLDEKSVNVEYLEEVIEKVLNQHSQDIKWLKKIVLC
jgi:hypothetical protein